MNRVRVWLIHRLGGVEKPPTMTIPGYTTTSNAANFTVTAATYWLPKPKAKRKWWQR